MGVVTALSGHHLRMDISTIEGIETRAGAVVSTWGRRAFLVALLGFVIAGLLGFLGVRVTTSTAEEEGWRVEVEHASISRTGIDTPWQVTVRREGGFDRELTLAVTGDYFDIFETQGFTPEPAESTRDGEMLYLTFTAPQGETFVPDYDAYIQPASQVGRSGTVAVVDAGELVAAVDFRTTLLP